MKNKERLLAKLGHCVLEMEDEEVTLVAQGYIDTGHDAYEGIVEGTAKGMEQAGKLYEEEYCAPELLICSDTMYKWTWGNEAILKIKRSLHKSAVMIGVIEGDAHNAGKTLCAL